MKRVNPFDRTWNQNRPLTTSVWVDPPKKQRRAAVTKHRLSLVVTGTLEKYFFTRVQSMLISLLMHLH